MSEIVPSLPAWLRAVGAASKKFTYGDTITRGWLLEALDVEMPDSGTPEEINRLALEFFGSFERFRKSLMVEHKMVLKSIGHGEYLVVRPDDQAAYAQDRFVRGVHRLVASTREMIEHTRVEALSHEGSRERAEAQCRIAAFEAMIGKQFEGVRKVGQELEQPSEDKDHSET